MNPPANSPAEDLAETPGLARDAHESIEGVLGRFIVDSTNSDVARGYPLCEGSEASRIGDVRHDRVQEQFGPALVGPARRQITL